MRAASKFNLISGLQKQPAFPRELPAAWLESLQLPGDWLA
jgi:hypothetical protein